MNLKINSSLEHSKTCLTLEPLQLDPTSSTEPLSGMTHSKDEKAPTSDYKVNPQPSHSRKRKAFLPQRWDVINKINEEIDEPPILTVNLQNRLWCPSPPVLRLGSKNSLLENLSSTSVSSSGPILLPIKKNPTPKESPPQDSSLDTTLDPSLTPTPSLSPTDKLYFLKLLHWATNHSNQSSIHVRNISDFKRIHSDLHVKVLTKFSFFIKNSIAQKEKIQWNDPYCTKEGMDLANHVLFHLYYFDQLFYTLSQKKDLCTDDLLEFKFKYLTFDWDLFGPSFLGQPIFSSFLSTGVTTQSTLSTFHLARLVLFQYKKLLSELMLIHKALRCPIGWNIYKRFAVATLSELKLHKEIKDFSSGNPFPPHFWKKCTDFSAWVMTIKETVNEEGIGEEIS